MVDSKRLTYIATTTQWTLPFCIALCSADLLGSVVEHGLALDSDDVGGCEKSSYKKGPRLLDTMKQLQCESFVRR